MTTWLQSFKTTGVSQGREAITESDMSFLANSADKLFPVALHALLS